MIDQLKLGNERFATGETTHPNRGKSARDSVLSGQHPHVMVLSCSDSRAPVEVLFDAGIGDIFVVRTAGHVLSDSTLATLEYGAEHLKTKVVVVLGHQSCGAVNATYDMDEDAKDDCSAPMRHLVNQIQPAVDKAKGLGGTDRTAIIKAATEQHIKNTIDTIDNSIGSILKHEKITIIGAYYNLDSGRVDFLEQFGKFYE